MSTTDLVLCFPSELGWFGLVGNQERVARLSFAHSTAFETLRAVKGEPLDEPGARHWLRMLAKRLTAYAAGGYDDFLDVAIETEHLTPFQLAVTNACRRIKPGKSLNYAELAKSAKSAGAARAVGNVMARNRVPIIVPCHRVLASQGRLGGYSMGAGLALKRQLLALEGHSGFEMPELLVLRHG